MKRIWFPAFLGVLASGLCQAQQPAAPLAPAAAAVTVAEEDVAPPEPAPGTPVQLLEYGSFELPRVTTRSPKGKGGNPLTFARDEWNRFDQPKVAPGEGDIVLGVTNEVAHSGRQSLFVDFSKMAKPRAEATLSSEMIPIHPEKTYRVATWGQVDAKNPLKLAPRIPNMRLQVDFFGDDMQTQVGQELSTQALPGSRNRPAVFLPNRWTEYNVEVKTPAEARYVKLTWSWVAVPGEGVINGSMFFDDFTLVGERAARPEVDPDSVEPNTPAGEMLEGVAPDATVPATPGGATPATPSKGDVPKHSKAQVPAAKATPASSKATPVPPRK